MSKKIYTWQSPPSDDGVDFMDSPSMCQTQFAADCDINVQIAKVMSGDLSVLKRTGLFYDATKAPESLHSALNVAIRGRAIWDNAPANVRKEFGTAEAFLDFLADERNLEKAIELGLVPKHEEAAKAATVTPEGGAPSNGASAPSTT